MAARGIGRHDGDWICSDPKCANKNFARRDRCNRCGSERRRDNGSGRVKMGGMELGKHMAEKSKGLFSPDDWQCKSCGNVNWARRATCNVCNTPKVGHVEERTGFGGGFMERDENPEKIQRNSDDEEYDEFGRIKKKFRGKTAAESSVVSKKAEEPDEEDDEEEDSDDDDLGKYAFDSDDAEEVKKDSKSKDGSKRSESSRSSRSSSRSHSRSRHRRDSRDRSRSSSSSGSSRSRSRSRSPRR